MVGRQMKNIIMEPVFNTPSYVLLISAVLSLIGGMILCIYSYRKNYQNRWLALYYIMAGYGFLVAFLIYARLIINFPWIYTYRTGFIAGFMVPPLSFLYIRSILKQKPFSYKDLLHFLPAIIFFIDFLPFYLDPVATKIHEAALDAQDVNTKWSEFSQGWIGIGKYYQTTRIVLMTIYWFWQINLIRGIKTVSGINEMKVENKAVIQWVKIFTFLQILWFVPYYISLIMVGEANLYVAANAFSSLGTAMSMIVLLLSPEILYGIKGAMIKNGDNEEYQLKAIDQPNDNPTVLKRYEQGYKKTEKNNGKDSLKSVENPEISLVKNVNYVSFEKLEAINAQIEQHMAEKKSLIKKGFTMRDLAFEMDIQPYIISAVINQVHNINFNDFLNRYRINYAISLFEQGTGKMITLEALAEQCGFNNRNTFTTAFKKNTGLTPSVYHKEKIS